MSPVKPSEVARRIVAAGPAGINPQALEGHLPDISRSTLNRRLAGLVKEGVIKALGAGRATRYASTSPLRRADIDAYFSRPWQQRPAVPFDEGLLAAQPNIDLAKAVRCTQIQALARPIDRHFLASFLVDLSWASSGLEGGTYSALDAEALLRYGQPNEAKPTAQVVLLLNHKRAAEDLWADRALTAANVCELHALLTDDHEIAAAADSDRFVAQGERGRPRDAEKAAPEPSAYLPPFRPASGYVAAALERVVATANELHPVAAALYLLTRIAYLQPFVKGNKRTSRLAANAPLLAHGLLPLAFGDVDKSGYIRGIEAFLELGSMLVIEQTFIQAYAKSVVRGSEIPPRMRTPGVDIDAVARCLADFVNTGRTPADACARMFLRPSRATHSKPGGMAKREKPVVRR